VAKTMAPYAKEVAHRMDDLCHNGFWGNRLASQWKSVATVETRVIKSDGHPALQTFNGSTYRDEPFVGGVGRSTGNL